MSLKKDTISLKLKVLPEKTGVYQFYNINNKLIYVGKAKNIKKRVSSYFNKSIKNKKTRLLVKNIFNIKYLIVDNETDALLLENNIIKKEKPKYNIQLKDDKTYPWICIKKEAFPRVFKTRRLINDGSKYFGPYPSVKIVKTLLSLIQEIYPLRSCSLNLSDVKISKKEYKVCLDYHLGNCKGGCEGYESEEKYNSYISSIENILKGKLDLVFDSLKSTMNQHANNLNFEEAQTIKKKLDVLKKYKAKSTIVSTKITNVDVITVFDGEESAYINYLVINHGAIIHGYTVQVKKKLEESVSEIIGFVLPRMRASFKTNSKEVLVSEVPDFKMKDVEFFSPKRGEKKALVDLSHRNAYFYYLEKKKLRTSKNQNNRILNQMRIDFKLKAPPIHIECFDNSNLQGTNAVSACVVFKNGKPSKKDYRHFNIKTVFGSNDFASIEEVVFRRYKKLLDKGLTLPQLIVIDGGKGQLNSALLALEKLGIRGKVAVIGIAKRLEEVFFPGENTPIYLDKYSASLKIIKQIRDEAHRFGITHHRKKRSKSFITSELTDIVGIGEKTRDRLMISFKNINKIKAASLDILTPIIGLSKSKIIISHFNSQKSI